jgi:hypothetical protein
MKPKESIKVRLLTILVPSILLVALFGTSLLGDDVFHRVIFNDGQGFFWGYCNNGSTPRTIWYQGESSNGPDPQYNPYSPFLQGDTLYYGALQEAGFNEALCRSLHGSDYDFVHSTFYHGIKLWTDGGVIDNYAHAQEALLEIGPLDEDFFHTSYDSVMFPMMEDLPNYPGIYVFFCDSSQTADTLICSTTGDRIDTRIGARKYYIQLRLRVDDFDTTTNPDPAVLWMTFGSGYAYEGPEHNATDFYNAIATAWQMDKDTTADTDTNPDTTVYLYLSQIQSLDEYNTIEFTCSLTYEAPLHLMIFWCGLMDLYLDWIKIHDQEYKELAMMRQNRKCSSNNSFAQH